MVGACRVFKDNYYARFHNPSFHRYIESHFSILINVKFSQSQCSMKCRSRVPGHGGCLYGYVKDNYYAMFHNPSYHRYKETQFSILLDVKF